MKCSTESGCEANSEELYRTQKVQGKIKFSQKCLLDVCWEANSHQFFTEYLSLLCTKQKLIVSQNDLTFKRFCNKCWFHHICKRHLPGFPPWSPQQQTKTTPVEKPLGKERMGLVSRNLLFPYLLGLASQEVKARGSSQDKYYSCMFLFVSVSFYCCEETP